MIKLNFRQNPFMTGRMKLKSPAQQVAAMPPSPHASQYQPPPVSPPPTMQGPKASPPPAMHGPLEFDQITAAGTFTVPAGMRGMGVSGDAPFLSTLSNLQSNPAYQKRVAADDIGFALERNSAAAAGLDSSKDMIGLAQKVGLRTAPTEMLPEGKTPLLTQSMTTRAIRKSGMPDDSVDPITSMRNQALDPESGLPIGMVRAQERVAQNRGTGNQGMLGFNEPAPSVDLNVIGKGTKTHTTDKMTQGTNSVSDEALGRTSMGGTEHVNVSTGRIQVSDREFRQINKVKGDEDYMAQSLNRGKDSPPVTTSEFDRKFSEGLNRAFDDGPSLVQRVGAQLQAGGAELKASGSYLADAAGKHMAGAVAGMGAVTISEGEMTASGLARGAFYGIGGGIVGRMAAGSLQGGALNTMGRHLGDALGGVSKEGRVGGAANKAGEFINNAMDAMSSGASQSTNAMRVATFGGAALAGFSMGRERSHSRGMNSSRGSRF